MAISVNGGGGGYGSRRRSHGAALSEINVTPFVDVVLVLLIIFMLTAHVMEFGIEVDVPKVDYVKDSAKELPVITITKTGNATLNGQEFNVHAVGAMIRKQFRLADGVYVRADKDTPWGPIAQITAALGASGLKVNMVTQPEDSAKK